MAKRSGAGALNKRITFQKRVAGTDEYGNPVPGEWQDQWTTSARLQPIYGSSQSVEGVVASRLAQQQPYNLIIRDCAQARLVRNDWRVVDARETSRAFNIKTIVNPDERGAMLEMLVIEDQSS